MSNRTKRTIGKTRKRGGYRVAMHKKAKRRIWENKRLADEIRATGGRTDRAFDQCQEVTVTT